MLPGCGMAEVETLKFLSIPDFSCSFVGRETDVKYFYGVRALNAGNPPAARSDGGRCARIPITFI